MTHLDVNFGFYNCFLDLLPKQVKVMHKQLSFFQNAISAYFAGNKQALDNCIKEFDMKSKNSEGKQPYFLEH